MWGAIFNFITGGLVGKIVDAFISHDAAKQAALNDQQRMAFNERQDIRQNAQAIRMATSGFWEMRALTVLIALPFILHVWLVALDTCFGFGWRIAKFPAPFDSWEGGIVLSFFGLAGGVSAIRTIAGAVALPKRQRPAAGSGNTLLDNLRR
jgi:hypothetical protein